MPNESTQQLLDAIRENFTPEGVALIASKLYVPYPASTEGHAPEREAQWMADQLVGMLGTDQYNAFIKELGL